LEEPASGQEAKPSEGERKYVTVLFSDLSGYTALSEKLDPEEVREFTGAIFSEIAKIIDRYEGFVEKYAGDAVMALFGSTKAHEDDPVRAIKAAREIHRRVSSISPDIENKIDQNISMHTGINTGMVVTGEIKLEKGTHGVAGDAINVAARLSSAAGADEILVGQEVLRQASGYFDFEAKGAIQAKGKSEPVLAYAVIAPKDEPVSIHGLSILRSELIGRKAEMEDLTEAFKQLGEGKGSIFSICGDAGTGKSRLVEEFKTKIIGSEIQWVEGHAYTYCQNIPYFPLMDLLSRIFHVEEEDHPEDVREKVESGIAALVEHPETITPYIGSLYSLSYPETDEVSPEFWKARLRDAVKSLLSELAQKAHTVFFLEDLHWADPSFVELLRGTLLEIRQPAMVLCVYRPTFSLFTSHQLPGLEKVYREIRIQDLSASEAQEMLASLLKSDRIPSELRRLVQDKAEGNPFYLEELINSLIESETLIRENGSWKLTRPIQDADISSTVHGIIAARLDRLEREAKRLLQEASVIGRSFLYEILKQVTALTDQCDRWLIGLERLDLIRTKAVQPDLEYIFKHALTQEVVYNGLLKKERQEIHERIGNVMERLFHERLSEFYEALAYHYKQGKSLHKAVDYLMKSGEKSAGRYAVEEAHQYYKEAFDILSNRPDKSKEEERLLIDLIMKWALVYYHRGDWGELDKLLNAHEGLAESLDDKARLGMFYAWLGFSLLGARGRPRDSYGYLSKALELGEEIGDQQVIGYSCTWLTWTCSEWGLLDEAVVFGERAQEISRILRTDQYLFFKSLAGIAHNCWQRGEIKKIFEIGRTLLDYGKRHSNIRSLTVGHIYTGTGYLPAGDFTSAIDCYKRAIEVAADPFYSHWGRIFLGAAYVYKGDFREAEAPLRELVSYCKNFGCEQIRPHASYFLAAVIIDKGNIAQGLRMLDEERQLSIKTDRKCLHAMVEFVIGRVYLQIVQGGGPKSFSFLAKNIGFLMKNAPFASQKAEAHLNKAIEVAKEIGAKFTLGLACLDLSLLHGAKGRKDQARKSASEAIQIFEECEAEDFLQQAKEALASFG
jgi:class 3 adenylate cyclase/tetratricopeptide (TPR) repeat protein